MKIEVIGIGETAQQHAKVLHDEIKKLLGDCEAGEKKKASRKEIKAHIASLAHELIGELGADPRIVMSELLAMSAVVGATLCKPNDGIDARKAYRKMAGRGWDAACAIREEILGAKE